MEKRFGLKECFIVPRSYDLLAVKQAMGRAGLQLLRRIVDNKQVIGLAWGTSIRELTRHAQNSKVPQIDADFVPLDGGPENIDSELHVNTLCYELARAFGGRCHYIYAPVITRTAEIRNAIVQDANYEKNSDFWKKLDIGLVGIMPRLSHRIWFGWASSGCKRLNHFQERAQLARFARSSSIRTDAKSKRISLTGLSASTSIRSAT